MLIARQLRLSEALHALGPFGPAGAAQGPAYTAVAGSAVPFAGHAAVTGSVPGSARLSVQVWLKPDIAAAEAFATAESTPGGAQYGHYLTPAAYTATFGPAASAAAAVASWLRAEGFTGVSSGPGRAYVRATGPVTVIDGAFRTSPQYYRPSAEVSAGQRALRANSTPVSVPSSLSGSVIGVTGLDNAAVSHVQTAGRAGTSPACSGYYGQHRAFGWPKMLRLLALASPSARMTPHRVDFGSEGGRRQDGRAPPR